jgi:WD40 repeat protein/serine/threonine protein kinase
MWWRVDTVAGSHADRDLLFEALAVHLGFVTRDAMEEARRARGAEAAAGSLAGLLVGRGVLTPDRRAALDSLEDELLARHGGDVDGCLDALSAFGRLRRELEREKRRGAAREGSWHPTLPSIPVGGARAEAEVGVEARVTGRDDDDDDEVDGDDDEPADYECNLAAPGALGNRFQLLHAHARGGIGVVSVAFDAELQREVALKQIKSESADDADSRARFLLEAEVTGRLEHPGIVPVYGLGFDAQGRPYYAMRFVRGITLDDAIARFHEADSDPMRRRDPRERALELRQLLGRFVSVCHTMAYAHSRGVLHRDLKPANVLLGPYNETLIVDWGLAKVLGRAESPIAPVPEVAIAPGGKKRAKGPSRVMPPLGYSSSTDTVAGAAFGTPAFMSPEQAEGDLEKLGPASDVYSLGAMLYTLVVGKPAFEYAWCEVTTLIARVKNGEFPPPRKVNPGVPRPLEAICLKAMARLPDQRYAGAEELAGEIESWLADEPVAAHREPRWSRLARWGRRHRPLVTGAGVLLVAAVVGLTLGLVLLGRAQRETEAQRRVAVREREVATFLSAESSQRAEALRRRDYINRVNLAYRESEDDNAALSDQYLYGCPSSLRNWEWSHVHRIGHVELETFVTGDPSQRFDIWSLAFSPDGKRIASGAGPWFQARSGPTAGLVVRDVETGREIFARRGEPGAVQAVAYSLDGKSLIAATGTTEAVTGAVLTCHDPATGQVRWRLSEQDTNILGLAISPDGKTLLCGCGGFNNYDGVGYARLRDAATGKEVGDKIPGGPGGVAAVAFSPDGKQVALANRGLVDVWDLATRSPAFQLSGHRDFVYAVTFSPDGKWVASGGWDQTIRLWDRATGRPARTMLGHRGFVRGLSFRPDSRQLISGSEDKSVRLWDVASGREIAAFHGHTGFVHCVAFSPGGVQAASGSLDGTIKLWPAAAPDPHVHFRNGSGWVGTVAFHPGGRRVATAHNGSVRVWDPRTGEELWRIIGPRGLLGRIGLTFSPDGKVLVATAPGGAINLRDSETGRLVRELDRSASPVVDAALSPDGTILATAGNDGAVTLRDMASGDVLRTISGHPGGLGGLVFSPDGRRLATSGEDRNVRVWETATGSELLTLSGHKTGVKDVAFSPDGRQIASVGGQYRGTPASEVLIWDATSGNLVHKLEGHTSLVTAVAYFPDGRRLATASDDRTVKLWDPETGEDVFTLRGHTSGVVSLAISKDGRQIASGSIDCSARIWSAEPPSTEIDQVRRRAAVGLVQSLFETYMLKPDVLDELRAEGSLVGPLRTAALEIAGRRSEDDQALFESAWLTILRPSVRSDLAARAVRRLEAASRLATGDPDRVAEYRHALALALYRAGRDEDALKTLDDLADGPSTDEPASQATSFELAVRAMAGHRLGRAEAARAALERLRSLVKSKRGARDAQAMGFLDEAEGVVGSRQ